MASSSSIAVRELPLFPLPEVVLFPTRPLPLHVFEFRYRIMMNTILEGDRRFGVLMVEPNRGGIARIGCCAEIINFQRLPDGRMKIITLGQQRFRLLEYVREKPYAVGLVEWLEDQPTEENLKPIAKEIATLFQDVVNLSAKLREQKGLLIDDIPDLPLELSYWVASHLPGVPIEQQVLLEMLDTSERLDREHEILSSTRSHLAALTALKDALP